MVENCYYKGNILEVLIELGLDCEIIKTIIDNEELIYMVRKAGMAFTITSQNGNVFIDSEDENEKIITFKVKDTNYNSKMVAITLKDLSTNHINNVSMGTVTKYIIIHLTEGVVTTKTTFSLTNYGELSIIGPLKLTACMSNGHELSIKQLDCFLNDEGNIEPCYAFLKNNPILNEIRKMGFDIEYFKQPKKPCLKKSLLPRNGQINS